MSLLKSTMIRTSIVFSTGIFFGFLVFRNRIFEVTHPGFGFILLPVIGSIIFSLKINKRTRDMIYASIILFLLDIFLTQTFNYQMIFTHLVFIVFLLIAIFLFSVYYKKMAKTKSIRPLILAALMAITLPLANGILWFIYSPDNTNWHLFQNLPYGFVMGLSIGIGIELSELVISANYWDKLWNT